MAPRFRTAAFRAVAVSVLLVSSLGPAGFGQTPPVGQSADLALINGKVITVDRRFSIKQAVAIRDGKFLAVGSTDEIRALAGPNTRVIDLRGRSVLPGLFDSHIHAIRAGLTWDFEMHWDNVKSLQQGLRMIADRARLTPPGTWIQVVGGWHESQFEEKRLPTPAELSEIAPDHPVWVQRLYERAILNRVATRALGITTETPDPPGGRILRDDATGQPVGITGFFGINSYWFRLPRPTREQQVESTRHYLSELNRVGLTAVGDVAGGGLTWPDDYHAINTLHDRGEQTVRVRWYMQPNRPGRELEVIRQFIRTVPLGSGDEMLRPVGVGEQVQVATFDGDAFGPLPPVFTQEALEEWRRIVRTIIESGWRFQVHATRNHSAEQLLPAIEETNGEIPVAGRRLAFAHLEDGTTETMQRIVALGGGITVQDRLVFSGGDVLRNWPEEWARNAPPLRTMLLLGIPVGGGTDATRVTPYNPWISLWWLITGKTVGGTQVRLSSQNLTRAQALRLYTMGSAWFSFDEDKLGSIEPGKRADLIVPSADYLTVPVDDVRNIVSLLTIVGGKPVYAAGEYQPLVRR